MNRTTWIYGLRCVDTFEPCSGSFKLAAATQPRSLAGKLELLLISAPWRVSFNTMTTAPRSRAASWWKPCTMAVRSIPCLPAIPLPSPPTLALFTLRFQHRTSQHRELGHWRLAQTYKPPCLKALDQSLPTAIPQEMYFDHQVGWAVTNLMNSSSCRDCAQLAVTFHPASPPKLVHWKSYLQQLEFPVT